jgi:hypothetical protein
MRRVVLSAGLSLILLLSAGAGGHAEDEPVDPRPGFIRELQKAVAANDKAWLAAHLHLPVRYFGKKAHIIRSKDWFLKHYTTVIGPELKANVLAQDPEKYFMNYQGLMVGDGSQNIWLEDFGDAGAGKGVHFEIITINNTR